MDNIKNNGQNSNENRALRDNFKNIQEFMSDQNYRDSNDEEEEQLENNRDLRDNFKNIREFMDAKHYGKD